MTDLGTTVSQESLLSVKVEAGTISEVINMLNSHIKGQNNRILQLEELIKTLQTKEDAAKEHDALVARAAQVEDRVAQVVTRVSGLSTDLTNLESKIGLSIDERLSEMNMTQNIAMRSQISSIDQQMQTLEMKIDNNKGKIQEVEERTAQNEKDIKALDIPQLKESVQNSARSAEDFGPRIATIERDIIILQKANQVNAQLFNDANDKSKLNALESRMNSIQRAIDSLNEPIPDVTDSVEESKLSSIVYQHKHALVGIMNDINNIKNFLENIHQDDGNQNKSSSRIGSLELDNIRTEMKNVQNEFNDHTKKVILAFNAVRDELLMIREFGKGLNKCPPLNLQNVVPSFFDMETSRFIPMNEEEEEEEKIEIQSDRPEPVVLVEEEEELDYEDASNEVVTREMPKVEEHSSHTSMTTLHQQVPTGNKKAEIIVTGLPSRRGSKKELPQVIQTEKFDEEAFMSRIRKELQLDELQKSFVNMRKDHDEVMGSLDKKIDREFVERVFDRFRAIVHGLNERVKELAELNSDFATKEEVQVIARIVRKLPKGERAATAVKKGPNCLFCGRPKTSIAGEISPRTAQLAGAPAVSGVGNNGNGQEFIYGDGQAFKRDENISFPHLDTLPPLPTASPSK